MPLSRYRLIFALVVRYARELKRVAMDALAEEAVLITVEQIYHAV
jgi:hypothetical protein